MRTDRPLRRCSVHAEPDADLLGAWSCPDDCPEFLAELERRIEDVKVHGDFTRVFARRGVLWRQKFRDHKPVGRPRVFLSRRNNEMVRIHELWARKRR
jgi:hypothetical protein